MSFSVTVSAFLNPLIFKTVVLSKNLAWSVLQPDFIDSIFIFLGSLTPSVQNNKPSNTFIAVIFVLTSNFKNPSSLNVTSKPSKKPL